jgi:Ca2+/Na+ antiporter
MNEFKTMAPYFLASATSFYLFPLLGNSTGSFILILLVIIPLTCFAISFIYGFKNGWNLFFPIAIGILFIPVIFIYFNSTAWVYIVGYSVISLAGVFVGKTIKNQ